MSSRRWRRYWKSKVGEFTEVARQKSIATRQRRARKREKTVPEWFWSFVEKTDSCWWWRGSVGRNGYGRVSMNRHWHYAHRLAWQITHGPIPPGFFVCHTCDQPPCVNPDHLFLGTPADNIHDARTKKRLRPNPPSGSQHWTRQHPDRVRRGEANNKAKLTATEVKAIRKAYQDGCSQTELAHRYGIKQSSVWKVLAGHTWKHVTGGESCL